MDLRYVFLFTLFLSFKSYPQNLKFDKLVVEDGLTSINSILLDDNGFTWFGGTHGLYRFDGVEFRSFNHDPDDSSSLSSDNIISLFQDSRGVIWIGTENNGVNAYITKDERILRVRFKEESLNRSSIPTFGEDMDKNIWIGTIGDGIYVVDSLFDIIGRYYHDSNKPTSLSNNTVFDLLCDKKGQMWVSTNSGSLDLFGHGVFQHYSYFDDELAAVRTGQRMIEDSRGKIWLGTEGEGLFIFDPENEKFVGFNANQDNSPIRNDVITDLGKDSKGNIWISTDGGGVNLFDVELNEFLHFGYEENNEFGLSNNASYSLSVDQNDRVWLGMGDGVVNISDKTHFRFIRPSDGLSFRVVVDLIIDDHNNLWAGTGGGGLDRINLISGKSKNFSVGENKSALSSDVILTVLQDNSGNVWAGTFLGGVNRITFDFDEVKWLTRNDGLSNDHVFDIVNDSKDRLWIATQGGGLNLYDPKDGSFEHFTTKESGLTSNRIQCLLVDLEQRLWIGFYFGGIQVLDVKTKSIIEEGVVSEDLLQKISSYPVHSLYQDTLGNVWIGTGGLGLIQVKDDASYELFDKKKGLPSNSIYGSISAEDKIWVSTNKGIASIHLKSGDVVVFDKTDGLLTSDFESGAIAISKSGQLYFSSKEGILHFDPGSLQKHDEDINVELTDFTVFNEKVIPGREYDDVTILDQSVVTTDEVRLPFSHNNFSISFGCPAFSKPQKIQYRYRLIGWQDDWIISENDRRFVPFANLREGDYVFEVQGSRDRQQWSASRSITVKVFPPLYRAWFAYVFYAFIILALSYLIFRILRFRIRLTNQLKFEKFSREKDNELHKEKINFFTGISHELRTPLTLILGPLEQVINSPGTDNRIRNRIMIIQKNANRLLQLINQLLDFRKMESGKMKLQVSQQDLINFIEEILLTFRELALQKNLRLDFQNNLNTRSYYFDESKLEIIFYNLLSNAIKFTEPGGNILVTISKSNSWDHSFLFEVTDTGKGISPENRDKIFDPFYRDRTLEKSEKGTGIGLSLVKNVVELHHGKISVASSEHGGTTFQVDIPGGPEDYDKSEIMLIGDHVTASNIQERVPRKALSNDDSAEIPKLLLVEDNEDILEFLRESFMYSYQVFAAYDGRDGMEKSYEIIPDIIISDIMMPGMDGIEMCRHLKNDIRTSHIPIILLTARSGFTHELSGLDTGADDYITKPFQIELLTTRANNLIENRKKLREKVRKDLILEPEKIAVSDPDEKFLKDLMDIIEEHISNSEYSVKDLAKQMGVSHSVLYRKIQALTNLTINDFIKTIRLKRSVQLLSSKALSVSEVSYKVGFSNPKYFSTCFKAEFGKSPSEFLTNPQPEIL